MSDRRGIERLRWLEEEVDHAGYKTPRWLYMELQSRLGPEIQIAYALIEELRDALEYWRTPQVVVK